MADIEVTEAIRRLDVWLDAEVAESYRNQPLAQDWARVGKVIEELGEAITDLIGYTGQNPRKGVTSTQEAMFDELADTIITGYLAIQHFTKDAGLTVKIVNERWQYRVRKSGLDG